MYRSFDDIKREKIEEARKKKIKFESQINQEQMEKKEEEEKEKREKKEQKGYRGYITKDFLEICRELGVSPRVLQDWTVCEWKVRLKKS